MSQNKNRVTLASVPAPMESAVAESTPDVQVTVASPAPVVRKRKWSPTACILITELGKVNHKRLKTQEWHRYAALADGMTVESYSIKLKELGGNASSMVTHIVEKGWAEVVS